MSLGGELIETFDIDSTNGVELVRLDKKSAEYTGVKAGRLAINVVADDDFCSGHVDAVQLFEALKKHFENALTDTRTVTMGEPSKVER